MSYKIRKLKYSNSGMTLIEAMTVIVIISVLVSIGVANYLQSSKKRALEASLQTNMRTLQIMLETYKVDWSSYPEHLSQLADEATNKKYNKSIANPYTGKTGPINSENIWAIDYFDPTNSSFDSQKTLYRGKVGFQPLRPSDDPSLNSTDNTVTKYYLLGYDDKSELIEKNGKPYIVTSGG